MMNVDLICDRCGEQSFEPGYQVKVDGRGELIEIDKRWPLTLRCAICGLIYRRGTFGELEKAG